MTVPELFEMKQRGQPVVALTAYDATMARLMEEAGVDVLLVGDSLGMVIQGHDTTLPVTLDQMVYHSACVGRGRSKALHVVDLPFMSTTTEALALRHAARLIQEGGAQMVKLEGGRQVAPIVAALTAHHVPVCGHIGLLPQAVHQLGGYQVQGRDLIAAESLLADALSLEAAGASLLVLECIPASLAKDITQQVTIPTMGIGAGAGCDGQVLVTYDLLGMSPRNPKFCRNFMVGANSIGDAFHRYVKAVRDRSFPAAEHSF
ncbi:MAG: 3-methyl-2-oxobutanoate hydroxymethyltransferase [Methylococcus sp.]|jgi:3-methyl-2-oxobutanoate hydroxymethyltransferase